MKEFRQFICAMFCSSWSTFAGVEQPSLELQLIFNETRVWELVSGFIFPLLTGGFYGALCEVLNTLLCLFIPHMDIVNM